MEALILSLLLAPYASGEYRAYELVITNSSTGAQRRVISNFDPTQYRDLYPVLQEEEITLNASWMCYGDTSKKPICPQPESQRSLLKSDPQ